MFARIEPLSAVIRVWVDGCVYGDPYEWVATVRWLKPNEVEILGYTKRVTPSIWKAIIRECQAVGITSIIATSYKSGERREKRITVPTREHHFYERE